MKLKQINFTKKPTPRQIEKLKQIIPYHKISINGNILIKKLNKHFDSYSDIIEYKAMISKETGIKSVNMNLTVVHHEENHDGQQ